MSEMALGVKSENRAAEVVVKNTQRTFVTSMYMTDTMHGGVISAYSEGETRTPSLASSVHEPPLSRPNASPKNDPVPLPVAPLSSLAHLL